jgi:hypothetical protein
MSDDASFDLSALLDAADRALYSAKARGRNCVELATSTAAFPSMSHSGMLSSAVNSATAMGLVYRDIDQSRSDITRALLEVKYRAPPIGTPSHEGGPDRRNVNPDVFDAGV